MGRSHEEIVRAAAAANLLTVFLKTRAGANEGRIAPVCGAALAAGGAAGGIAMLRGDDADCVERMLRTVLGNVCGMVCDGAKANCAAKAGMALHGAMQALALAEAGLGADEECGIVARTAAESAGNVYRLAREGAGGTDRVLCRIEEEKQGGWR